MKSRFKARRGLSLILVLMIIAAAPATAFATDVAVTADSVSVKVGDSVTLTVVVSAGHIAVANGVFTYDPAMLSYVSSNGGASDGYISLVSAQSGGSDSLTAVIKLIAIGEGNAEIVVSMDSVLGYDGTKLENAQAGVSVAIAPSGAAGEPGAGESVPPLSLSQTGVPAQNVLGAAEPMYIWRSLSSLTLPSGFADRQVEYGGEYVNGAAVPDSEDILLLYLSGEAGDNAGYYIYSAEKNTLYPYVTVTSALAEFTLLWPEETLEPPAGYEETTISWKEREMPAWKAPGSEDSVYLVYARNAAGETGFYLYNMDDKSVQRYTAPPVPVPAAASKPESAPAEKPAAAPAEESKAKKGVTLDPVLFYALCGVGAVLIAAVAVLTVLYVRRRRGALKKGWKKRIPGQDVGA